jgi:chromate reductase, NAD(P)H dehydrogenase (quinone)
METSAIVGSLRRDSYNRAVLRAAQELAPDMMTIKEHPLDDVPLYNHDVEQQGDPHPVAALKGAIAAADALLIITPEYQHGVPGVLKNALDWASRPPGRAPLQGKPVAIMGASPGMTGTARAQTQLRQTLVYNGCRVLPPPEILISRVHERVTDGVLTDDKTREFIEGALHRLVDWVGGDAAR